MGSHKTEKFSTAQTAIAATSGFEIRPLAKAVRGVLFASSATMAMAMPGMTAAADVPAGCVHTNLETVTCAGSTAVPVLVTTTIQPDPINDLTVIIGDPLDPAGTSVDIAAPGEGVIAESLNIFGDATVINNSAITTYDGPGVIAFAGTDATVTNDGTIVANYGPGAIAVAYGGNAVITNNGTMTVNEGDIGALALSKYNDVLVTNNGDITVNDSDGAAGVLAMSKYEDATVVTAEGSSISAASAYGESYGIVAVAGTDSPNDYAVVTVGGAVESTARYSAMGVEAFGSDIDIDVTATGSVAATAGSADPKYAYDWAEAVGIYTEMGLQDYAAVDVAVDGAVSATAFANSWASATGVGVDGTFYNEGYSEWFAADSIAVSNTSTNSIEATATVFGSYGEAVATGVDIEGGAYTTVDVYNVGSITATATAGTAYDEAFASNAYAQGIAVNNGYSEGGPIDITNAYGGTVTANATTYGGWGDARATGIDVYSKYGEVNIVNDGAVIATADAKLDDSRAFGIEVDTYNAGIYISGMGTIDATAAAYEDASADGIDAWSRYGNIGIDGVVVTADATAQSEGYVEATVRGIDAYSEGGSVGINGATANAYATATSIYGDADANAKGVDADAGWNGGGYVEVGGVTATVRADATAKYDADSDAWGVDADGDGGVTIDNYTAVDVTATASSTDADARANAWGVRAYSEDGGVYIDTVDALVLADAGGNGAYAEAYGIDARSEGGDVIVKYAGVGVAATADSLYGEADADAKGIDAYSESDNVVVYNAVMDVSATARSVYDEADADVEGIDADAGWGGSGYVAIVGVTGDVAARAYAEDDAEADAQGIDADSRYGEIYISNVTLTSTAEATSYLDDADADAEGIDASAENNVWLGDVTVTATANATAYDDADADAEGLDIYSEYGDVRISNADTTAMATAVSSADDAYAEAKGAQLDTGWTGGGGIYVEGLTATVGAYATGYDEAETDAWGIDAHGDSGVHIATADIAVVATADATYGDAEVDAWGIDSYSEEGNVSIYSALVGVSARATSVYAEAEAYATGVEASTLWGNGYVEIAGVTATVAAGAYGVYETDADATGIDASTYGGNISIGDTSATVTATAASSGYGDADADATGIDADSYNGNITVDVGAGNVVSATATASSSYDWAQASAVGVEAESYNGDVMFSNAGDISADATATANPDYGWGSASATGVYVEGQNTVNASNDGSISATAYGDGAWATGMFVRGYDTTIYAEIPYSAPLTVTNNGNIYATATGIGENKYAGAIGIEARGTGDEVNVVNGADGVVIATANATGTYGWAEAIAVHVGSNGDKYSNVTNYGLLAAYATGAYAEAFAVYAEGDANTTIDNYGTMVGAIRTGDGYDVVNNFSGNTWFATGVSDLGGGDDVINNIYTDEYTAGRIVMTDATINLGYSGSGNQFNNQGLLEAFGDNVIRMGNTSISYVYVEGGQEYTDNPYAFNNTDGTISMINGDVGDSLLLIGDFYSAGSSTLNVDVDGAAQIADTLYITGDVIAAGPTVVNGNLLTMPNTPEVLINVVSVAEGSAHAEGDFVAGELTVNPESFLTYELDGVFIPPSSPSQFVFSISTTGLSDPGVTAAALSPAVQNLWQSGVGTLHQRQGAVRDQLLEKVSVWLRTYRTDGTLDPDGKQSNLEFDQENTGFELGIDAALNEELRLGLLFGQSEADVSMNDAAGSADIDGDTWGIYLTWMGTNGWYSDLSYRRMDFDGDAKSSGGKMDIDGEADGWNLEVGKTITLDSGLQVEPQFQYTDMEVDLDDLVNSSGVFSQKDGDSTQARLGVMLRKAYQSGTAKWTPYGSLSVVEEFDGENSFNVAGGGYTGDSDIGGTSLLLESGVNAQFGDIIIYGGLNYQDGDALDSILGGQLGVRFSW